VALGASNVQRGRALKKDAVVGLKGPVRAGRILKRPHRVGGQNVRKNFWLSVLLPIAFGCAHLAPKPYVKPPATATLEERQKFYDRHRIGHDAWTGFDVGGGPFVANGWSEAGRFARYFARCGDAADAAALLRQGSNGAYALGSGLLGAAGFIAITASNGFNMAAPWPWLAFGGGLSGEIFLVRRDEKRLLVPAARAFNRYLAQELGLSGLPDDPGAAGAPRGLSPTASYYGYLGAGLTLISTYDIQDYYLIPGSTNNRWPFAEDADLQWEAGAGMVRPNGTTLELRFEDVNRGHLGRYYTKSNGAKTPAEALNPLRAMDLGLIPGYTFVLHETYRGQQYKLFAGCQVGAAYLMAEGTKGTSTGAILGHYQLEDWAFAGGPVLRFQGPMLPGFRFGDFGYELGYRMERFTNIQVTGANGYYAGRPSPDQTLRGTPSALDFSGPFMNVSFMFGRMRFSK
jgi:hypothetical protein